MCNLVNLPANAWQGSAAWIYSHALIVGRGARQGSRAAYNALGILHLQGLGVPVNYTRARQLFEVGGAMGEPDCYYNLAVIYAGKPHAAGMLYNPARHSDFPPTLTLSCYKIASTNHLSCSNSPCALRHPMYVIPLDGQAGPPAAAGHSFTRYGGGLWRMGTWQKLGHGRQQCGRAVGKLRRQSHVAWQICGR